MSQVKSISVKETTTKYQSSQQLIFSWNLKKEFVEVIVYKRVKVRDVVNLNNVSEDSDYRWLTEYSTKKNKQM